MKAMFRRLYHTPLKYTSKLDFLEPSRTSIPTFQVLNFDGEPLGEMENLPSKSACLAMHRTMLQLSVMDKILYDAQRQGRISFYMTNTGEEAAQVGSAQALKPQDHIFGQYRESGVLMHRGFELQEFMDQCFGNERDPGKGRQMPVHYASRRLNFYPISSPLGTQIPQAAGVAYGLKMKKKDSVVMCYFGDGAASEGDFHAGLNMAAILKCPVIYFCRNNGYAISTPTSDQYAGDGIAVRGPAYGIPSIRVDGNDILAVLQVTEQARERALKDETPVLIEAITYRVGHHSTSDDWTSYRSPSEVQVWTKNNNPITRFSKFLKLQGWWDEKEEKLFLADCRERILQALSKAEKTPKPPIKEMFTDVYKEMPEMLKEQWEELQVLMKEFPDKYPISNHANHANKK